MTGKMSVAFLEIFFDSFTDHCLRHCRLNPSLQRPSRPDLQRVTRRPRLRLRRHRPGQPRRPHPHHRWAPGRCRHYLGIALYPSALSPEKDKKNQGLYM